MAAEIKRLGDAELEIMQAVWGAGEAVNSAYIQAALAGKRNWSSGAFWPVKSGAGIIFIPRWSVSPTTASGRGAPSWKSSMEIP